VPYQLESSDRRRDRARTLTENQVRR